MYTLPLKTAANLLKVTPNKDDPTPMEMYEGIHVGNGCLFATNGAIAVLQFDDNAPDGWVFVPKKDIITACDDIPITEKFQPSKLKFEKVVEIYKRVPCELNLVHCLQLGLLSRLQEYAAGRVDEGEPNFGAIKQINTHIYAVEWEKTKDAIGLINTHTGIDHFSFDPLLDRVANLIAKSDFF